MGVGSTADAAAWRRELANARVDHADYAKALAVELKTLVCSGGDDAVYVLRGLISNRRLEALVRKRRRWSAAS
jgi:hypothetical protein